MTDKASILNPNLWVQNHSDYLYNYALYKVSDNETAQDLVQETFIAGLKGAKSFQGNSAERTWLVSILKRKIIDHYRRESVRKNTGSLDATSPFNTEGTFKNHWSDEGAPGKWNFDRSNNLETEEFQQILELCLSLLPHKWREAFHLKMMEDCTGEEICKELDITSSNLWVMIHRAKLKLRDCIEKNWLEA
ncbi:MAG: sigma-70 family RNA polymerase sigma factor [Bacteroidales bacterium]|nr:sigma-70 family RNA polymerase sigma factor [Bacteroidales bacterium]